MDECRFLLLHACNQATAIWWVNSRSGHQKGGLYHLIALLNTWQLTQCILAIGRAGKSFSQTRLQISPSLHSSSHPQVVRMSGICRHNLNFTNLILPTPTALSYHIQSYIHLTFGTGIWIIEQVTKEITQLEREKNQSPFTQIMLDLTQELTLLY